MQRPASPPFGLPSHVASNAACACGAQTILSLTVQAITVLAPRSTPPKKTKWAACSASLRPHQRDGVTLAPRRDVPDGVGTRNVPQDSPSPPARVEQGTMATKPKASKGACPSNGRRPCARRPSEHVSNPASAAPPHRDRRPATNRPFAAQSRASAPSAFCKSDAYWRRAKLKNQCRVGR